MTTSLVILCTNKRHDCSMLIATLMTLATPPLVHEHLPCYLTALSYSFTSASAFSTTHINTCLSSFLLT